MRALKAYPKRTGGIFDDVSTLDIWNHGALGSSECYFVDPMSYLHGASHICRLDEANIAGTVVQVDVDYAFNRFVQFMVLEVRIRKMSV